MTSCNTCNKCQSTNVVCLKVQSKESKNFGKDFIKCEDCNSFIKFCSPEEAAKIKPKSKQQSNYNGDSKRVPISTMPKPKEKDSKKRKQKEESSGSESSSDEEKPTKELKRIKRKKQQEKSDSESSDEEVTVQKPIHKRYEGKFDHFPNIPLAKTAAGAPLNENECPKCHKIMPKIVPHGVNDESKYYYHCECGHWSQGTSLKKPVKEDIVFLHDSYLNKKVWEELVKDCGVVMSSQLSYTVKPCSPLTVIYDYAMVKLMRKDDKKKEEQFGSEVAAVLAWISDSCPIQSFTTDESDPLLLLQVHGKLSKNSGWIGEDGISQWIIFKTPKQWIIVNRMGLSSFVSQQIDFSKVLDRSTKDLKVGENKFGVYKGEQFDMYSRVPLSALKDFKFKEEAIVLKIVESKD